MTNSTTFPRRLSLLILIGALLAGLLVVVGSAPASAAPTQDEFEVCLLDKINADRVKNGAVPLEMAWDRIDDVRDWSEWMRNNTFRHMTSAERNPILPPGTYTWAENIAMSGWTNVTDCSQIHTMFMNSSGHRKNILNSSQRFVALGAYYDSSGWWVTELFFASSSYDAGCDGTFCDDDSSVFEADIEKIAALGITSGCNPPVSNQFCPDSYVTRGQMAKFLVRMLGLSAGGSVDFSDDDDSVFEADIEKLAASGITKGCGPASANTFCPDSRVTRGMMAAFLVRALNLTETGSVDFVDDNGSIFEADIEKLAAAGITQGCGSADRFCPNDPVTRGMMAAFIVRSLAHLDS